PQLPAFPTPRRPPFRIRLRSVSVHGSFPAAFPASVERARLTPRSRIGRLPDAERPARRTLSVARGGADDTMAEPAGAAADNPGRRVDAADREHRRRPCRASEESTPGTPGGGGGRLECTTTPTTTGAMQSDAGTPGAPDGSGPQAPRAARRRRGPDPAARSPLVGDPSRNLNLFPRQIATVDAAPGSCRTWNRRGARGGWTRSCSFWEGLGRGLGSAGAGAGRTGG
ncbi:hypothetical protein THAOC_28044, partial [Thalassiosira oceanica]